LQKFPGFFIKDQGQKQPTAALSGASVPSTGFLSWTTKASKAVSGRLKLGTIGLNITIILKVNYVYPDFLF
jgi:hypothetical protein